MVLNEEVGKMVFGNGYLRLVEICEKFNNNKEDFKKANSDEIFDILNDSYFKKDKDGKKQFISEVLNVTLDYTKEENVDKFNAFEYMLMRTFIEFIAIFESDNEVLLSMTHELNRCVKSVDDAERSCA